jgi:hypothetical protein
MAFLPRPLPGTIERPSADGITVAIVFTQLVPLAVHRAQRWILHRPQPLARPNLLAADDAIRTASVRALATVGTALVLPYLAVGLVHCNQAIEATVLNALIGLAALASVVLALVAWSAPRRPQPPRAPAPAEASA